MGKRTILIADDERSFRKSLALIMRKEGFDVIECNNGVEAIVEANNNQVDALVIDIRMPNIDGITALTSINELKNAVPTIIITAYSDEVIDTELPSNVVKVFIKPFNIDDLITLLKSKINDDNIHQ